MLLGVTITLFKSPTQRRCTLGIQRRCVLGDVTFMHCDTNEGKRLLPRQYFWSSFEPTQTCLDLMNRSARGIEGIEQVRVSDMEGTTFLLVLRRGVNPVETAQEWFKKFRKDISRIPAQKRPQFVGGIPQFKVPEEALAADSRNPIWHHDE